MFTDEQIKAKVTELLQITGLGTVFPLPIEVIVEYLGFQCHFYIPDEDIEDVSSAVSHTRKKIYINQNKSVEHQLFTIAFNVGHIVLHGDNHDYIDDSNPLTNGKAQEATNFALQLLMPETNFYKEWHQLHHNIGLLAQFFGVSEAHTRTRATQLNLISHLAYELQ